jgi:hypothetical protein
VWSRAKARAFAARSPLRPVKRDAYRWKKKISLLAPHSPQELPAHHVADQVGQRDPRLAAEEGDLLPRQRGEEHAEGHAPQPRVRLEEAPDEGVALEERVSHP